MPADFWRRLSADVRPMALTLCERPALPVQPPLALASTTPPETPALRWTRAIERARRAREAAAAALRTRVARQTGRPPVPVVDPELRRQLVALRCAAGLGQRELAGRLNVSRAYLAEIERGRRAGPSAAEVARQGVALLGAEEA